VFDGMNVEYWTDCLPSGCLDFNACNHDADAEIDDGSCLYLDCKGNCGGSSIMDCLGACDGDAYEDECGTCDADGSNDCMQDCSGTWGGDAVENEYCLDLDGDGQGDMDTLEWFCSDDVSNGFIEDCSDDDDDCANGLTDVCGICGGAGPEYICSDGNPACNEEECNALVANHFFPAYLEESDNPYMAMNVNVTSALLDGFDLETGDEIGIFDGDVCV
jgi:hypothetical protein